MIMMIIIIVVSGKYSRTASETNIVGNTITCEVNKDISLQLELVDQYENRVSSPMCNIDVVLNYNHRGNNPSVNVKFMKFDISIFAIPLDQRKVIWWAPCSEYNDSI